MTGGPGRRSGTAALARTEARHLARSPLLWLGFALAAAVAAIELRMLWPALAGDDMVGYRGSSLVGGGALLAGAWLASRDRASGTADLVAVTPTARWRLGWARLLAVAAASAAVFALLFAGVLAASAARGGRGLPDLRLLADGALAVALSGLVGMAVGRLAGSRVVPLLVAPAWVAGCLYLANDPRLHELPLAFQRLSPLLGWEERSAAYGFLPDALWPHLGYLLGLLVLAGVLVLLLAGRGDRPPPVRVVVAAALAGLVLAAGGGAPMVTLPDREVLLGPDRADRRPVDGLDEASDDPAVDAMYHDRSWRFPDDGRATACATDASLSVCVYPAYGEALARYVHGALRPVAELFRGLPGVPERVRMVPNGGMGACPETELQVHELFARGSGAGRGERDDRLLYAHLYLGCAVGQPYHVVPGEPDAREAVMLWALLASGILSRADLARATGPGPMPFPLTFQPGPVAPYALAMAELPPERVRQELAPRWERLRAGELAVSELPGRRP
jgi:hypothetical protein